MEQTIALKPLFNEIAAAIHEKDGLSDGINAYNFPERIRAIPTGLGGVYVESISIVTPPNKTIYSVNEAFDPTGMEVSATYSNRQTMLVSAAALTFDPSGPLEARTTSVTVNFKWGLKMVSASQAVLVYTDSQWSPRMTSDTAPAPFAASASSSYSDAYLPWKAFDGIPNTSTSGAGGIWYAREADPAKWIQFDFGAPRFVAGIKIAAAFSTWGCASPREFTVLGGNSEHDLREIIHVVNDTVPVMGEYREYLFQAAVEYRFYRINCGRNYTSGSTSAVAAIGDIRFFV